MLHAPAETLTPPSCRAVALLVDGENTAADLAGRLILAVRPMGALAVLRVYGDTPHLGSSWRAAGFQPVLTHAGKNVTDMAMTVAAMELSFAGTIDGFAIVSQDRDFAPLVWSLRARGLPVWGLCAKSMPEALARSYTRTVILQPASHPAPNSPAPTLAPTPAAKPATTPVAAAATNPLTPGLDASIRAALTTPMNTVDFGNAMHKAGHNKPKGAGTWAKWLARHAPYVRITGTGKAARLSLV